MPSRPSQTSDAQLQKWRKRRQATGARIREVRLAQSLSQEALALECGLSRNMIIGIEWGRKSVAYERLWDVADVLGVPLSELLEGSAARPEQSPYRGGRRPMGADLNEA
ncbi:helix-turn-helix transcriptional regulator [Paenarthrobacter sp. 4246]|uniref:helix-turn-helix domain-containing protein n=1 Tax=Paenarthrobacter sp. 4246 TaxID=3156456 RepID=UPI0033916F1F